LNGKNLVGKAIAFLCFASNAELQKIAQRLIKLNGEAWEEELVDIFGWLRI